MAHKLPNILRLMILGVLESSEQCQNFMEL